MRTGGTTSNKVKVTMATLRSNSNNSRRSVRRQQPELSTRPVGTIQATTDPLAKLGTRAVLVALIGGILSSC
jgi:hypothetical protein